MTCVWTRQFLLYMRAVIMAKRLQEIDTDNNGLLFLNSHVASAILKQAPPIRF